MPSSASTVNQTLTNYAAGIAQDRASALAEFIAPTVPVGAAHGQFKRFESKNQFQTYDTARAVGGPAKRIHFEAEDPFYNAKPQALEIPIDDHERELAGEGDPLGLEMAKVDTLVTTSTISHEAKVFATVAAAVSAVGGVGVWSNAGNDPVADLDAQIESIAIATGRMPNRIVMGIGAWRVFRSHPKVIERQPGAALIGLNAGQASAMLLNPGIELRIGVLSQDTTKFGAAKSAINLVGARVYVFHAQSSPSIYDPSFAKTFRTRAGGVDAVRTYRDEPNRSDIVAVDWSEDIQVVSTELARRIDLS